MPKVEVAANEVNEVNDVNEKYEKGCEPKSEVAFNRDENEKYYREMHEVERKDRLAIEVMALTNDTHTDELKELASKYLKKRFK